jgi:predicted solute-binding protein
MPPRPAEMLRRCDAALLIGDAALFFDHETLGLGKLDLGERWTSLTGLPFVWAFWAGRPGVLLGEHVRLLLEARDAGVAASDAVADAYCRPDQAERGRQYLKDNIRYDLGARELEGLNTYYELAQKHDLVDEASSPVFYRR